MSEDGLPKFIENKLSKLNTTQELLQFIKAKVLTRPSSISFMSDKLAEHIEKMLKETNES
jgi:cobalamin biosynthesis protein CbiD